MSEPVNIPGGGGEPRPRISIGMGDPAGIGPEIVVKALADPEIHRVCVPVVIGDARVLAGAPGWRGGEPRVVKIAEVEDARPEPGVLSVLDLANVPSSMKVAEATAEGGSASLAYLTRGVELARAGRVEALVSAPSNKAAMLKAGTPFPDEYEYLAHLCGVDEYMLLMVSPHFTLASVTLHVPMRDVADLLTQERVLSAIRVSMRAAKRAGVANPRVGVAALNPHAGEGGAIGTEERDVIRPAVEAARAEGIDAHGPFPADTFFMTVREPAYDVYVGMYHDQGRIAMKLLDFTQSITTAEGLPVLLCTTGHGTAYNIAGRGIASPENLKGVILYAARQAVARRQG